MHIYISQATFSFAFAHLTLEKEKSSLIPYTQLTHPFILMLRTPVIRKY